MSSEATPAAEKTKDAAPTMEEEVFKTVLVDDAFRMRCTYHFVYSILMFDLQA